MPFLPLLWESYTGKDCPYTEVDSWPKLAQ